MKIGIKLTVPSLRKIFGDVTPPAVDDLIELENNSFDIQLEANTGTDAIKIEKKKRYGKRKNKCF